MYFDRPLAFQPIYINNFYPYSPISKKTIRHSDRDIYSLLTSNKATNLDFIQVDNTYIIPAIKKNHISAWTMRCVEEK